MTLSPVSRAGRLLGVRGLIAGACLATSLLVSPSIFAQSASRKAAAEALFDEGVELLKSGEYDKACKKLESSQQIDPGIGTLLYLGECYKKAGRTASAWATFREAASKAKAAGEQDRARAGMQRADKLESVLSRLTINVDPANMNIEGMTIEESGNPVNKALWGSAVPVNPGQLMVRAHAPGYEPFETQLTVKKGPAASEITIPALVALPEEEPSSDESTSEEAPQAAVTATPEDAGAGAGSTQATVGLVIAGAGVVGLGVGGVFGLMAINKDNEAKEICGDSVDCPFQSGGEKASEKATSNALVATIGFAAGGALLAGGAILYFLAPSGEETARVTFTPTAGGGHLGLGGSF